jgi:hypothetical protein
MAWGYDPDSEDLTESQLDYVAAVGGRPWAHESAVKQLGVMDRRVSRLQGEVEELREELLASRRLAVSRRSDQQFLLRCLRGDESESVVELLRGRAPWVRLRRVLRKHGVGGLR